MGEAQSMDPNLLKVLRPKIDVVTRWNSIWAML